MTGAEVARLAAAGQLAAAIVAVPLPEWEARAEEQIANAWIAAMVRAGTWRRAGH
jgi:hypothetical protein